jgi:hypothetical protein
VPESAPPTPPVAVAPAEVAPALTIWAVLMEEAEPLPVAPLSPLSAVPLPPSITSASWSVSATPLPPIDVPADCPRSTVAVLPVAVAAPVAMEAVPSELEVALLELDATMSSASVVAVDVDVAAPPAPPVPS